MKIEVLTNKTKLYKREEFVLRLSEKGEMKTAHDAYSIIEICFPEKEKYITKWNVFSKTMEKNKRCQVNIIDEAGNHYRFMVIDDSKSKQESIIEKDYPGAGKLPQYAIDTIIKKNYHHN